MNGAVSMINKQGGSLSDVSAENAAAWAANGSAVTLHARASASFDGKLAQTVALLKQVAVQHAAAHPGQSPRITQASSLGAEDVVISHLIESLALDIAVFVLNTGKLHAPTLQLLQQFQSTSTLKIDVFKPVQTSVITFVQREGDGVMFKSVDLRKACCHIRKVEPLARALEGKTAWITGMRREQSGARADVPSIDTSDASRAKVNPLADWTWGDVWHYIRLHNVPYNPLHDHFFPSIGCEPCTRAIALGEDFRAGRWWWEDENAKECGLHVATAHVQADVQDHVHAHVHAKDQAPA